jgi:hypothetical protein
VERKGNAPADGTNVDDSAVPDPDQRQKRLGNGDLPDQVYLKLRPKIGHRLKLQGRRFDDAGVVNESGETSLTDGTGYCVSGGDCRRR